MDYFDNEYDIRPYIQVLLRNWWKIGLVAFLFAVIGFAFVQIQSPEYVSTANIIIRDDNLRLLLADQFQTVPNSIGLQSRTESFQSIANSDDIAKTTIETIGNRLPEDIRTISKIQDVVFLSTNGEIMGISARIDDPVLASEIANVWADSTVTAINQVYNNSQPLAEIQQLIAEKQAEYQAAQTALEEFYASNSLTQLETELTLLETSVQRLGTEKSDRMNILIWQKQTLEDFIFWTNNLSGQLNSSNSADLTFGETLATISTEIIFGRRNPEGTSNPIDLIISDETFENYNRNLTVSQIGDLVDQAAQSIEEIDREINTLITEGLTIEDSTEIQYLTSQIQRVRTNLEKERALERDLVNSRDLTLEAYNAVLAKENELRTLAPTNNKVALVNPAIVPDEPEPRNTIVNTLIAGVLGGVIIVTWILIQYWWTSNEEKVQT